MLSIPISLFILVINLCTIPMLGNYFDRIINFGDSISDTGNAYLQAADPSDEEINLDTGTGGFIEGGDDFGITDRIHLGADKREFAAFCMLRLAADKL